MAVSDPPLHTIVSRLRRDTLQGFRYVPHRRHAERAQEQPITVAAHACGLNGRLALWITNHVGTMWCAYLFAAIGSAGIFGALTSSVTLVLLVGAVSGYFLQLVLLPIIIVGQNLQAKASDTRAQQTYADAEAVLAEALQIQQHLAAQDAELTKQTALLSRLAQS